MKLIDLDPQFIDHGGEGITKDGEPVPLTVGIGITFNCPCGCNFPCFIPFDTTLDGKVNPLSGHVRWHREGTTFETLTLTPSILRPKDKGGCGWHGFITNGEIINA